MKKLLCFDLDGTLTPFSTWEAFNTRLGISAEDDFRLFKLYKEGSLEYKDWILELMRLYKENAPVTKQDIETVAEGITFRPEATEVVRDAKMKDYHIIVLSGSVDSIVGTMAARLGIDEWFTSNKAVFNENDELVDIEHGGHERDAKLLLLQEFCSKNGYEISEVITVGDGGNDLEIFKKTKGILLGHNAELAPLAWKQIDTLSELKDIL